MNDIPEKGDDTDAVIAPMAERFLREMVVTERFCGAAMVSKAGSILHKAAYGPTSRHHRNTVDCRYHVGSLTKQFTAAAIMRLVECGEFELSTPVNECLPATYRSAIWADIAVAHLLAHTSGIPDYAITRDYYDVVDGWAFEKTMDGMIREAMARPLDFPTGTQFRYANIGYTLLGKIIEARSGRRYADYVSDELLRPAGMTASEVHDARFVAQPEDAPGLHWDDALGCHVADDVVSLPVTPPDGGLVTTLADFARWMTVYRDTAHPNLSKASITRMLRQSAPTETFRWPDRGLRGTAYYGLGVMRSGDLIMHEGSIVGFRSFFIYSRDDDLLIAVFANTTSSDVFRIAKVLFELHE